MTRKEAIQILEEHRLEVLKLAAINPEAYAKSSRMADAEELAIKVLRMEERIISGRLVIAPTSHLGSREGILDVPKCPWCGAEMSNVTRDTPEGWMSYYRCDICHAKAPAVFMAEPKEELDEAAKMIVNCRFLNTGGITNTGTPGEGWNVLQLDPFSPIDTGPPTNGDLIRRLFRLSDAKLAVLLWKYMYDNLEDKIDFCKDLPECEEMIEHGGVPEEKCLQCLIQWLGAPAQAGAKEREIATAAAQPRNNNEER